MTNRVSILTVALEADIREDDVQPLVAAIKQLRGVIGVDTNVVDSTQWLAQMRLRDELGCKIINIIYPALHSPDEVT